MSVTHTRFFSLQYDTFGLLQFLLNRFGLRHNILFDLLRGQGPQLWRERRAQVLGNGALLAVLVAPLALVSLLVACAAGLCRCGGVIQVQATRRAAGEP